MLVNFKRNHITENAKRRQYELSPMPKGLDGKPD